MVGLSMRKKNPSHRRHIRGLFFTLSATVLATSLSFAQSSEQFSGQSSGQSSGESSGGLVQDGSGQAFVQASQSASLADLSEISSQEFAARTPQINSVYPLPWEAHVPQGFEWSDFALKAINTYGTNFKDGARDVTSFCPNYNRLQPDQKINFWGQLIGAMTLYESGFKINAHFREGTMGTDRITGEHVYSDGLLQLSYQDVEQYKFCNEFEWSHDRQYIGTDPRKTIFDPFINLRCGIRILNAQIARSGMISFRKGQYWSVLWPAHVAKVKAVTRKIPYCSTK